MSEPVEAATPTRRHRRWLAAALILFLIVAALLVPLISMSRYHRTIADSLTRSLGHTVHLGEVNLELFPLPGLAIHDLVVEEDPSFGAEPLLRAPSVTVSLRLSSLWRQRLEISRIDLDDASVNLARNSSGRWNFASLLLQASRTATAPTAQRRPSATPRFPYIEFKSARINFKEGNEKKALSFLNADAAVWLADPNEWRIRFEAQPARTDLDLDLEDAGTVRLEGSLTRATSLDELPLKLHAEWTGAQLGQVSRLMLGNDSGWRGDLRADADFTGDMRNLAMQSRLRVTAAHRQEFTPRNEVDIDASCRATYHHPLQSLGDLTCLWPTGDGHLLLTGSLTNLSHPQPHLNLEINHTPVAFAANILGLLRNTLPPSLSTSGTINGNFTWAPENLPGKLVTSQNILTGHAIADTVAIRLADVDPPVTFAALRFDTPSDRSNASPTRKRLSHVSALKRGGTEPQSDLSGASMPGRPVLLLEPATFAAGAPTPMQVTGQFRRSSFNLHFTGEGSIARLQSIAGNAGQLRPAIEHLAATGTAEADLTLAGPWIPPISVESGEATTAQGALRGWIRLQHTQLQPGWLPEPIEIATATAQFGDNNITWANANISVNGIAAKGSASYPVACDNPQGCPAQVNLDFSALDAAELQSALLGRDRHGELVQAILSRVESPAPAWPPFDGTIHATTLSIGALKLNNARAAINIRDRRLNILSLDSGTLGGSIHATGSVEAASDGPTYALNITWTGVSLPEAASLFHEKWGTGSVDGQMNLNLHGYSSLASTATGDFRWLVNGSRPANASALPFLNASQTKSKSASWAASGTISNRTLSLEKGPAVGTITFDRKLDLTWSGPETGTGAGTQPETKPAPTATQRSIEITGTLAHPIAGAPAHLPVTAKRPIDARGN